MVEKTAEQLSAMMDGECPAHELPLALRRLAQDAELKQRWERYHLIGDVLNGHVAEAIDSEFAARLQVLIAQEPPLSAVAAPAPSTPRRAWARPALGFGLAASLTLGTLLVLRGQQELPSGQLQAQAAAPASTTLVVANTTLPTNTVEVQRAAVVAPVVATATTATSTVVTPPLMTAGAATSSEPDWAQTLNQYLLNHNEYASRNSVQGVLPYVRMVGHEPAAANR